MREKGGMEGVGRYNEGGREGEGGVREGEGWGRRGREGKGG